MRCRAGSLAGGGLRSFACRARYAAVVVPSLVLGGVVSGAALPPAPAAAAQEVVETARTVASPPPPEEVAAVDPAQTTTPSPAPVVEPAPAPEPAPPSDDDPAPADPVVPAPPAAEPAPEPPLVEDTHTEPAAPEPVAPEPGAAEQDEPSAPDEAPAPQARAAAPQSAVPDATAAVDDEVVPAVVPDPTTTQSVVTVKVGGVRTTLTQVAPLAGVTLQLFDGGTGGPTTARPEPWATCVSDGAGDCSFVVPETGDGGANRDARFWVRQAGAAPGGYFANPTLAIGGDTTSQTYQFRTGVQLRGGTTYTSTTDFMVSSGRGFTASGGIWQSSLTNPGLPPQCGLRVALVVDLSGSVGRYITEMRGAASTFVDSLTGTPSSVALFTFADDAPAVTGANLGLTPVSTPAGAQTVKNRIATYTAGFDTNWDRGLYQVAASSTAFDVAVVLTDGNPTVYAAHEGPGDLTRFREVENGVFSANAVKAEGTRVIAVGVGDGLGGAPDNLRAISGSSAGSDYYQTDDYAEAGEALRDLALGACTGSVSVVKQVVPSSTSGETVSGARPSGGWTFEATTASAGVTPAVQTGSTVAGTGAVNFPLQYAGGSSTATVTVTEQQQDGFTLVTQASERAVCTDIATGDPVEVTNDPDDPLAFSVDAPATAAITCTVYNRAPQPQAGLTVDKEWVVNGTTYTEGNQPIGLDAQLTLDGTPQAWSSERGGYAGGAQVEVDETTGITGRDLCEVTGSRVTEQDGQTVDLPVPSTVTLAGGDDNHLTVTNTVTCEAELTLVKQVAGGPAQPTEWALDAVAPDGSLPGPSGATGTPGASALVTPGVRYPLVESGDGRYVQTVRPGAVLVPPSTGSWQCEQVDADGTVVPGFNDGINGGVTVPLGFRVRCTSVNQSATLTLVKEVVNDDTGTAEPADWTLTATPTGEVPDDVVAEDVPGSTEGVTVQVRPGTVYDLTESGPEGYAQASLECSTGPGGTSVPATSVSLAPLDSVTCVFVNDDLAPTGEVDLSVTKTHAEIVDGAVDSGSGQRLDYTVEVSNVGVDPVAEVVVTDPLPDVVGYVGGTLVAPEGWDAQIVDGLLTATHDGDLAAGAVATFTYAVVVGDVPRVGPGGAYEDVVNTACVSSAGLDVDLADNCATDTVPVKSVAVQALAVCVDDTPYVSYQVTPSNVSGAPVVTLIWWTAAAYAARDTTIDASDTASLLVDGASQVDRVELPAGWVQGDTVTGEQLWPGAAVDADGAPVAWPGWTERADGTWFLDPAAPFYELRGETVVEVRVNPSTGATLVYPPATPECTAAPPVVDPPGTVPPATPVSAVVPRGAASGGSGAWYLPKTGPEIGAAVVLGSGLLVLGAVLVGSRRRRGGLSLRDEV